MKQVIFKNQPVFYRVRGAGLPVMLLHGFAEDHAIWKYQSDRLEKDYRVIAPDLPGSGRSPLPADPVSIDGYAEVVRAVAAAAIGPQTPFALIGHSMGGYIALAFAEQYPELLTGLGMFHSTATPDDEAKKAAREKGIEFIRNNSAALFLRSSTPNLFCQKSRERKPYLVEKLIDTYREFSAGALIGYYQAMMKRPDRTAVLWAFRGPVAFIIGKGDPIIPLQTQLWQSSLPGISLVTVLGDAGHMGMWEAKKKSLDAVRGFLRFLEGPCGRP